MAVRCGVRRAVGAKTRLIALEDDMNRIVGCAFLLVFAAPLAAQPPAPVAAQEQAPTAAAARVAPCVVQIDTTGGTELLDQEALLRRGTGPTTGLVVSADGFIISSAFNFADKPAAVFVAVPGRPTRLPAKV